MNNDVVIKTDKINFNYRIAIVIKNGNKVLLQKDDRTNHLTLPGGRCRLGESSKNTAIREMKEETGLDCIYKNNLAVVENFFVSSFTNKKMHEILMFVELEFKDEKNYHVDIIKNIENEKDKFKHLTYIWKDVDNLQNINVKPGVIKNIVKSKEFLHYIIEE